MIPQIIKQISCTVIGDIAIEIILEYVVGGIFQQILSRAVTQYLDLFIRMIIVNIPVLRPPYSTTTLLQAYPRSSFGNNLF
jgi:hypothetical protein